MSVVRWAGALMSLSHLLAQAATEPARFDFSRPAMGTIFRVSLHAPSAAAAKVGADAAFARVDALNRVFSDYDLQSELMRLCHAEKMPVMVSDDLLSMITRSLEIAAATDGAFDLTTGRMTQLWRRSRRQKELPSPARIAEAKALTGWRLVSADAKARTVALEKTGVLLDLGGVAKGRAADEALAVLARHGISQAIVIAGGDMAIGTAPPRESGWPVQIRTGAAADGKGEPLHLRLQHCGVSTSGDLHQFIEIDGQRYSHIVDPRTGLGLTTRTACTVIARDCTTSDGLATAMCVMGREKGMAAAARSGGVEMRFAEATATGDEVFSSSPGFPEAAK